MKNNPKITQKLEIFRQKKIFDFGLGFLFFKDEI